MIKFLFGIGIGICIITTISCNTNTENGQNLKTTKVIINADSCKKWDLQNVNFELEYPENYNAEYNINGYYLRLRKMSGDTIIQEIVFGNAGGKTIDYYSSQLNYIDSLIKIKFEQYGQNITTNFIGNADFLGKTTPQIRTTIAFNSFQPEGQNFIMDGEYSTIITFLGSQLDSLEVMTVSTTSSNIKEQHNKGSKISVENETILKTLKMN